MVITSWSKGLFVGTRVFLMYFVCLNTLINISCDFVKTKCFKFVSDITYITGEIKINK